MKRRTLARSVRVTCEALELRCLLNAPGTNYTLAFDDEFNGTNMAADPLWKNYLPWTSDPYEGGNYLDYMVNTNETIAGVNYTSNVSESGGQVHLNTQSIASTPIVDTVANATLSFTGAMMTTNASFSTQYGYAEIRAQLPTGFGNWPAFWSLGSGWPPENDIMEDWPGTSASSPRFHQGLYGMDAGWHDYNDTTSSTVPSSTFHTYAMQWGPGFENFYVDDKLAYSSVAAGVPAADIPTESMYFLLNSGVAQGETANYSNSASNELNVDYVRIYTYTPTAGAAIANPGFNASTSYTLSGSAAYNVGTNLSLTGNGDLHEYGAVGEADQTITSLLPNTTYIFGGYAEIGTGTTQGLIGVKNYNGSANTSAPIGSTTSITWVQGFVTFTTGPTNTSATIYVSNPGTGNLNFDDLSLTMAPQASVASTGALPGGTVNIPIESGIGKFSTITATSSDQTLVTNAGITVNASHTSLAITALAGVTGTTTITLTATANDTNTGPYSDLFVGSLVSSFVVSVLPEITASGTTGQANTFRVVRNGANVDIYVNNTTTTPTIEDPYSAFSVIALAGQGTGNTLTVDYSGGDPVTAGGISFTGGAGTDSINFTGLSGTNTITLNNGSSVQINSDFINYTNVDKMNLDLGTGTNTLASVSPTTLPAITLTEDAGGTTSIGGASGTLPSRTIVNVNAGGTFSIANAAESLDQVSGAGTLTLGLLTIGGNNGTSTFSGVINGSGGGLTKVGTGTLLMTGNNTFTGAIAIGTGSNPAGDGNGILRITTGNAINHASSLTLTDNNGSYDLFQIDGTAAPVSVSLPISLNANNFSGPNGVPATLIESIAGNNTISSTITFNVGGNGYGIQADAGSVAFTAAQAITHILYLRGAGSGSFTNTLSSTGGLTFQDTGNWTLSGTNTYTGATIISSGEVTLTKSGALGTTASLSVASGATLALQGGITIPSTVTFSPVGAGVGGVGTLLNVSGNNTWSSALALNAAGVTIGATAGQLTLASTLSGGPLTKVGIGALLLNGANTYTGSTKITGGTLELATGSIATATINVSSGAALTVDANTTLPAATAMTNAGTVTFKNTAQTIGTFNGAGAVSLTGTALTITAGGTISGLVSGTGSLIVSSGALGLSGVDTYTGGTTVSGGSLEIGSPGSLADVAVSVSAAATLTVDSGASISSSANLSDAGTVNFNNATQTIATLNGMGALNLNGTALTISNGGIFSGPIGGNGSLIVGGGLLTLTSTGTIASSAITINALATADINGVLTAAPAVIVNGNLNFGSADASNDPTSDILPISLGSLTVGGTGDVVVGLASSSATRILLATSSLSNVAGGTLDLTNNDMIVFGGDATAVSGEVTSSAVAANPTLLTLAVYQNDGDFSTFDKQSTVAGDVLVKYTFFGDADLSGGVDATDYTLIDSGFNSQGSAHPLTGWLNGDFNGDGKINGDDYTLIDNAFNEQAVADLPQIAASNASQIAAPASVKAGPFSAGPAVSVASVSMADPFGDLKKRGRKIAADLLA